MKCKINGCDRDAMYKERQVCQMHYFRYMRNGTYELKENPRTGYKPRARKYRYQNPAGYQKLHEPDHVLADSTGYVYEHRLIIYSKYGDDLPSCEMCGSEISWDTCHVDHKDEDVTNNHIDNIRPVCRGCNTSRTERAGKIMLTHEGRTRNAMAWAREDYISVCGATIIRRKMMGMSDYDALFSPKRTHNGRKWKNGRPLEPHP